jgi:hypothetical protein
MSGPRRRWAWIVLLVYAAVCAALGLVLIRQGAEPGELVLIETWLVIFYLAGWGVVLGFVPLFRRYILGKRKD